MNAKWLLFQGHGVVKGDRLLTDCVDDAWAGTSYLWIGIAP